MTDSSAIIALVVADDDARAESWKRLLEGADFHLLAAAVGNVRPDVVLADGPLGDSRWQDYGLPANRDEVGTVIVGQAEAAADVRLAEDAQPRELVTACRLVAEIARLRRRLQAGERARQILSQQALTDPVTGLPNRRAWNEGLAERLSAGRTDDCLLCLAIFDLDHFKPINDRFGHPTGDRVLRRAGEALRSALRHDDFLARLGGDEFGLLLTDDDADRAAAVVERVRRRLTQELADDTPHRVTASAGYAVYRAAAPIDPEILLKAADAALLRAKDLGRDRTVGQWVEMAE